MAHREDDGCGSCSGTCPSACPTPTRSGRSSRHDHPRPGRDPRTPVRRAGKLVAGLAPEQLDHPTPNPGWDVRALLNRVYGGLAMFTEAGRGGAVTHDDPADVLGADPAATLAVLVRENLDGWRRPYADQLLAISGRRPSWSRALTERRPGTCCSTAGATAPTSDPASASAHAASRSRIRYGSPWSRSVLTPDTGRRPSHRRSAPTAAPPSRPAPATGRRTAPRRAPRASRR